MFLGQAKANCQLESFLGILNGAKSEEIVWTGDISYWLSGQTQAFNNFKGLATEEGYLKFCQELGVMPYYWYEKFWLGNPEYKKVEVVAEIKGCERRRIFKTPVGQLEERITFTKKTCSEGCTRHFVRSREDLKVLLYILENRRLIPDCIADYEERAQLWRRYDGLPCVALPRSPLPAFFVEWADVQDGVYLLFDCAELVENILDLFEEQEKVLVEAVCNLGPPLVHFADNLTSEVFTGFFDELMAPRYKRRVDKLHSANIKCAVHLDGTVRGLLPKLAAVGIEAIEALTPRPAGDMEVEQMREAADNEAVVLWGGVPGALFAYPYTWDDMRKHLERVLESWRGQAFVLGVADQVPPDGDIAMVKKISDLVRNLAQ